MIADEIRKNFGLDFLSILTASTIPHALLRNPEEIAAGTFKDIDLIAPTSSFTRILSLLEAREDVNSITVIHFFSRSQIEIYLAGEAPCFRIDIDYQLTLTGAAPSPSRLSLLTARSVTFSDLGTCRRCEAGKKITVLDPNSELLMLKNHARRKPKEKYLLRIKALEQDGITARHIMPMFGNRGSNLVRRYLLIIAALPRWLNSWLQLRRAAEFRHTRGGE